MIVTLTELECLVGAFNGCSRRVESLFKRREGRKLADWEKDIDGACAEIAVSKAIGRRIGSPIGTFHAPDVGTIQVRHTKLESGCLIHRREDSERRPFVLVVGEIPTYTIVGWLYGKECRKTEWLKTYNNREPAWFVPQQALRKFEACVTE